MFTQPKSLSFRSFALTTYRVVGVGVGVLAAIDAEHCLLREIYATSPSSINLGGLLVNGLKYVVPSGAWGLLVGATWPVSLPMWAVAHVLVSNPFYQLAD